MNPNILGVIVPGFLNQVPTLGFRMRGSGFRVWHRGLGNYAHYSLEFRTLNPNDPKPKTLNSHYSRAFLILFIL